MIARYLTLLVISAVILGCGDPRDTKIPNVENLDSIQGQVGKLTEAERALLKGYLERKLLYVSPAQAKIDSLDGVTIRQAIKDQEEWITSRAAIAASAEAKLAATVKANEEMDRALNEALSLTLDNRQLIMKDGEKPTNPNATELVTLEFQIKARNNTDKEISGIEGSVEIQDMFGNSKRYFPVSHQEPLIPAQSTTIRVQEVSVYSGNRVLLAQGLADTPLEKLKIKWNPRKIVFTDGTVLARPHI